MFFVQDILGLIGRKSAPDQSLDRTAPSAAYHELPFNTEPLQQVELSLREIGHDGDKLWGFGVDLVIPAGCWDNFCCGHSWRRIQTVRWQIAIHPISLPVQPGPPSYSAGVLSWL